MSSFFYVSILIVQALVYFIIWFLYGYGSQALNRRENWEQSKRLFDVVGVEILAGRTTLDQFLSIVGFWILIPLPILLASYFVVLEFSSKIQTRSTTKILITFLAALVCIPLGQAIVNASAIIAGRSIRADFIEKLREAHQRGADVACALVSYDPQASKSEMDACVASVSQSPKSADIQKTLGRFIDGGKVKKFTHHARKPTLIEVLAEGAIDNWTWVRSLPNESIYYLDADLRELSFLRSTSDNVMTAVPADRQIWFLDTYTDFWIADSLNRPTSGVAGLVELGRFLISMEMGWTTDANTHFKNQILPKIRKLYKETLDNYQANFPENFRDGTARDTHVQRLIDLIQSRLS